MMRLAPRLPRLIGRCALATATVAAAMTVALPHADAEPAPGLCSMNTGRGSVPNDFAVAACVDGTAIWMRNSLDVPVRFTVSGDTGKVVKVQIDLGIAATATRLTHPDSLLLLPSDIMRVPVGSGTASVTLADADAGGFYVLATTLATFLPIPRVGTIFEAFTDLIKRLADAFGEYRDCISGKNWLGQLGCSSKLTWQVTFSFGLDGVKVLLASSTTGPAKIISLLLDVPTYLKFLGAQVPAIRKIRESDRTITLSRQRDPALEALVGKYDSKYGNAEVTPDYTFLLVGGCDGNPTGQVKATDQVRAHLIMDQGTPIAVVDQSTGGCLSLYPVGGRATVRHSDRGMYSQEPGPCLEVVPPTSKSGDPWDFCQSG